VKKETFSLKEQNPATKKTKKKKKKKKKKTNGFGWKMNRATTIMVDKQK
jgi:hypothetical protein